MQSVYKQLRNLPQKKAKKKLRNSCVRQKCKRIRPKNGNVNAEAPKMEAWERSTEEGEIRSWTSFCFLIFLCPRAMRQITFFCFTLLLLLHFNKKQSNFPIAGTTLSLFYMAAVRAQYFLACSAGKWSRGILMVFKFPVLVVILRLHRAFVHNFGEFLMLMGKDLLVCVGVLLVSTQVVRLAG